MGQEIRGKKVIGVVEKVRIFGAEIDKEIKAKIDTGATKSSIDMGLASELNLGPVTRTKLVRSASGTSTRAVIEANIELAGKRISAEFTLADRKELSSPVLIGLNVLKRGFIIDPDESCTD